MERKCFNEEMFIRLQESISEKVNKMMELCFGHKFNTLFFALAIVSTCIGIYMMNLHTTLIVDDYGYSFSWASGKRVTGVVEILESQYKHYFSWGGRVVVHFLAQLFLMIDKHIFDILNTLAYLAIVMLIHFHAIGDWRFSPAIIIIINCIFFSCMPAFGQVFLWVTGAANYLWGPILVLLYLLPFRFQMNRELPVLENKFFCVIFGLCGIIAAWTNENMGVTLFCMILSFILWTKYKYNKIYFWTVCALVGTFIGATALILAPGNFVRLGVIAKNNGGSAVKFVRNFFNITKLFLQPKFLFFPLGISTIMLLLRKKAVDLKIVCWYFFGMLISMYSMMASPFFADRAKSGTLFLATIVVCSLYYYLDLESIKAKKIAGIVLAMIIGLTLDNFRIGYKDIKSYEQRNDSKVAYVLSEKEKGNEDIIVPRNYPKTKYCAAWGLEDLNKNPKHWTSRGFARYWGVKSVRTK